MGFYDPLTPEINYTRNQRRLKLTPPITLQIKQILTNIEIH